MDEISTVRPFLPSRRLPLNADYFCPARNFIEAEVVFTFRLLQYIPSRRVGMFQDNEEDDQQWGGC